MRKNTTRKLAASLAILLSVNCLTPAFAGIDTFSPSFLRNTVSASSSNASPGNASPDVASPGIATPSMLMRALPITITDENQLAPFFPDSAFRAAVFKAVEGETGADVEDILANFTGSIKANKKRITDITGIHLLRKAESIDLRHNEIKDLTLAKAPGNSDEYIKYYGGIDDDGFYFNSTWDFGGNPIELVPEGIMDSQSGKPYGFGGRLVIKQAGTTSYTYSDVSSLLSEIRQEQETFTSKLNVHKCDIVAEDGTRKAINLESVATNINGLPFATPLMNIDWQKGNNEEATLTQITRSGIQRIAVGTDQVLHYGTSDEYGLVTPGSQSFKYYLYGRVQIYDAVEVTYTPYKGSVVLQKVDSDTQAPLAGAKFDLFKANGILIGNYTTNASGRITVLDLEPGAYYFSESDAPTGYITDPTLQHFTIAEHKTTIGGGLTSVSTSNGQIIIPPDQEDSMRYIAGPDRPDDGISSPNITLTRVSDVGKAKVTVTYTSLNGTPKVPGTPLEKVFYSVEEAEQDINTRKNANIITGKVKVHVEYINTTDDAKTIEAKNTPKPPAPDVPPKPEETSIAGRKTWVDEMGYTGFHPDIRIVLYQNGIEMTGEKYHQVLHDGQEDYSFHQLPKKDPQGNLYVYTVKEEFVDPAEESKFLKEQNDYDFKNTYINGKVVVEGNKGWDDSTYTGEDTPTHPDVSIMLYQNGRLYGNPYIIKSGSYHYRFTDLPERDSRGNLYTYTVKELDVPNYVSTITKTGANTWDILNTHGSEPPKPNDPPSRPPSNPPGGPGVPPSTPPTPGENVPPPPLPREPEEPGIPNEPNGGGLPKTGQSRSISLWVMLGSLGLLAGMTLTNQKAKNKDL